MVSQSYEDTPLNIILILDSKIYAGPIFRLSPSAPTDIHLVRVPQDVDVLHVRFKPAKGGERPVFFSAHVDSYGTVICLEKFQLCLFSVPTSYRSNVCVQVEICGFS